MPLELVKRHGSPLWYFRGSVRGVAVDESTMTADREQAEALRAKREWEIVKRQIGGNRAVATFLEASVSYSTAFSGTLKRRSIPADARQVAEPIHRTRRHTIGRFLGEVADRRRQSAHCHPWRAARPEAGATGSESSHERQAAP